MLTINTGLYAVHAETDDGITHRAELLVSSWNDMTLRFLCRPLLIDLYGDALSHVRRPEDLVDCMTCIVRERVE